MILVIYVALGLALICAWGWGTAACRLFGLRDASIGRIWIGLSVLTALSVMLHLLVPLSAPATAALAGLGLLFAAVQVIVRRRAGPLEVRWAEAFAIALCLAPIAWLSAGTYVLIDTALYHLQSVMWYEAFPVVPGLANLHGRFGFNSSVLTFASLFQSLPGGAFHYATSVWIAAAAVEGVRAVYRMAVAYRARRPAAFGDIAWVLMLLLVAQQTADLSYPSLTTDLPPFLAAFPLLMVVLRGIRFGKLSTSDVGASMLIVALLVSQKLSYAVFGAACLALITTFAFRAADQRAGALRNLIGPAVFCALWGVAWLSHGVILTGYPLYPQAWFAAPVDWRVPKEMADNELAWIVSWARWPSMTPADTQVFTDWIFRWVRRFIASPHVFLPVILTLVVILVARLRRWAYPTVRSKAWLAVPIGFGLAFWFLSAPDVRFAYILLWGVLFSALALFWQAADVRWGAVMVAASIVVLLFTPPNPLPAPTGEVRPFTTDSGLVVQVPIEGDRCFDAPLPCTPYPDAALELRGETFADGFRVRTLYDAP